MKVICIKDSEEIMFTRKGSFKAPDHLRVFVGEEYTVVEEVTGYKGEKKWVLAEKPSNCRYRKIYFAPLSEIDEMELVAERKEVLESATA